MDSRTSSWISFLSVASPAAGVSDVTGVRVHGHWVHGEVGNQERLPVFEAAATSNLLRYRQ